MKNTYDFLVQARNLLLPLSLKVLRHKERDTHSFYSGFFICSPISCAPVTRPPRASESQPSSPEAGLNSTNWLFQNLPKSFARFRCMKSFALSSPISIWAIVTSEWHVRPAHVWTPALMLHLSNPCTELKGSQPN